MIRWGSAAVAATAIVAATGVAAADPAPFALGDTADGTFLSDRMEYLHDPSRDLDLRGAAAADWRATEEIPNFGFSDDAHWFRFRVHNDTGRHTTRLIELSYPPLDHVAFHVLDDVGAELTTHRVGDREPTAARPINHRHFVIDLEIPAGATRTVYLRVVTAGPVQVPLQIWSPSGFATHDNIRQIGIGIFYGVLIVMMLYNLFLYVTVRERDYLHYVSFVAVYAVIASVLDGTGPQLVWPSAPGLNAYLLPVAMSLSCIAMLVFTRGFLHLRTTAPRSDKLFTIVFGVLLVQLVSVFVVGYAIALGIAMLLAFVTLCIAVVVGVQQWRAGLHQARLYVIAWSLFFIGTALILFQKAGYLPVVFITDNAQQIGVLSQVVLLSFALADYINVIKREKERAQEQALETQRAAAENLQREVDRQTEALRDQAARLKEADVQKTRFFQNVSHELRTPLTLILTPLEQLARDSTDRRLHIATNNARRLLRLVNQLLEFQKLAAGRRELALVPINLAQVARRCGDYIADSCAERQIAYRFRDQVSGELGSVALAEVDAVEKILFNYLSNALKFTPGGGTIEVVVQSGDGRVRVTVADSGPGIRPDQHDHLFQVFSQLDNQANAALPGTGLGLAFARELAEAMGGAVGVTSEPGAGASFWLELAVASPADLPAVADDVTTEIAGPAHHPEIAALAIDEPGTAPDDWATPPHTSSDAPAILIVDDLPDMRALLRDLLSAHGFQVRAASSGSDALRQARDAAPALIITDWMMPGMSGPELIAALRARPELASTPTVLLTARSDEESRVAGTEIGADAFLGKPFNEAELMSTVSNLLRLKAHEHEIRALNRHLTENVLKRYLPPSVVEDILAGRASIDGPPEKYNATVLFADLVGFTEMTRKLRVAKMSRLLNDFLGEMCEAVFMSDGTVDKFIGDAVMAVFGAPIKVDPRRQIEQAIACAHAMQEGVARLTTQWEREGVGPLRLRIGIHQGPLVMGNFGNDRRSDFTAVGPTVNMAARLQHSCPPGEVFVSGEVYDYLPEHAAEPAGEFQLRGIGSVLLYRLVSTPRSTLRDMGSLS